MRLNDPLITSFFYGDKEYPIDLSFDNVLDVFDVHADKSLRGIEKVNISLALLIGDDSFEDPVGLWGYVYTNFIESKDKTPIQYDRKGNPMPKMEKEEEPVYDLVQDADYIYSSFRQAYGMNLFHQQGILHWVEFKALLNSLPSDTILQRIIKIRTWEPQKGESSEYKQSMRELQAIYALKGKEGDE